MTEKKKRGRPKGSKNKSMLQKSARKGKPGPVGYSAKEIKKLGESLVEFVSRDDVFHIVSWTRSINKTSQWFYQLKDNHPELVEYHNKAKDILGNKVLSIAMAKGDPWTLRTFIPKYLPDVEEYLDKRMEKEATFREQVKRLFENNEDSKANELISKIEDLLEHEKSNEKSGDSEPV